MVGVRAETVGNYGNGDANSVIQMLEAGNRVSVNTVDGLRNERNEPQLLPGAYNVFSGFLYAAL